MLFGRELLAIGASGLTIVVRLQGHSAVLTPDVLNAGKRLIAEVSGQGGWSSAPAASTAVAVDERGLVPGGRVLADLVAIGRLLVVADATVATVELGCGSPGG